MPQITTTFLERSKLEGGAVVWRGDPACQGLRVRVSLNKSKSRSITWYYRYKRDDKLHPMQIGEYPAMTLEEARQIVTMELRPLARAGHDVKRVWRRQQAQEAAQELQTIRALVAQYLESCRQRGAAEGTIASYRRYLRPVANWWADRLPAEINRGDVQDLFYRVMEEGVPPVDIDGKALPKVRRSGGHRAAGLAHSAGRGFWTWLVDRELAAVNPWKDQKQLADKGKSGTAKRALSDNEIIVVLSSGEVDQRDRVILRLLLATGLRPNEVCGAEWSEIDIEARTWTLPAGRLKYKASGHTVALSAFAAATLKAWRRTQRGKPRYVFPASGSKNPHVVPDNLVERFKRLGVEGFSPKVCRSTFRTGLQRLGCPLEVRQYMSHHQQGTKVEKSYDQYDFAPEAAHWWQQWGIHLAKLEKGKPGLAEVVKMRARG